MSHIFTSLLPKLYWPLVGLYVTYLLISIMLYFTQIDDWSDRAYYNAMNAKRIVIPFVILSGSLYLKYSGNEKMGHNLLFIPAVGVFMFLLLGLLLLVFMTIFFGK